MTIATYRTMRPLFTLAIVALALVSVPANGQGLGKGDEAALRALSAAALKALQPLVDRADAKDRKALGEKDKPKALLYLYLLGAEQGDGDAQTKLGLFYGKGLSVPRDLISAHKWFSIASDQGAEQAAIYRNLVAKLMSPADIAEAQRMAHEWLEAHPQ